MRIIYINLSIYPINLSNIKIISDENDDDDDDDDDDDGDDDDDNDDDDGDDDDDYREITIIFLTSSVECEIECMKKNGL